MKLYDVPNNTKIRVIGDIKTPIASKEINENQILSFKRIDGMYSLCKTNNNKTVHLVAWAEVEIMED